MSASETVVAILTPTGRGAVATVAVRGPRALAVVQPHFAPASGRPLASVPAGRIQFGRFRSALEAEEEIVAVVIGPEEIELHCHGGPVAAAAIMNTLVAAGAQCVSWQEWVAAEEDELRSECRLALAAATTERTCAILLDQYRGALAAELALIDAQLPAAAAEQRAEARVRLERLLALATTVGRHLTIPWRVVIAGQPNVGKSSLINALLGYERSIVYDQPGTTRDALSARTAIDGWPVELVDTAGLRPTVDPLETAGIARAEQQLAAADLVLLVTDVTGQASPPESGSALLIGNKVDLLDGAARHCWQEAHPSGLLVSARTGEGLAELCRRISRHLAPSPPRHGEAVPFAERQVGLVHERLAMVQG